MNSFRIQLSACGAILLAALGTMDRFHSPGSAMAAETTRLNERTLEQEGSFDELVVWLKQFHDHAQKLQNDLPEGERIEHLREISLLLADRGLFDEADRYLTRALESSAAVQEGSFADSLRLAEFRMEAGRVNDALLIVQRLSIHDKSPEEQSRVAVLHAEGGAHFAALGILEELMPKLPAEMKLLRARCLWESGALEEALRAVNALASQGGLSQEITQSLVLLRADCLFGLDRWADAESNYENAMRAELTPEKAAWIRFQLGNLAHRQGHWKTARAMYGEAAESWPRTFYGRQSEWFLRMTDRIARLAARGAA